MSWRPSRNFKRARRPAALRVRAETRGGGLTVWRVLAALVLAALATGLVQTARRGWLALRDEVLLPPRVFGLHAVEVHPDPVWLSRQDIVRWTGVRPGDNLLALDLDRIKRDLELVPQIEEAALERLLPDRLRIWVRERQPVARVLAVRGEHGHLVPATYFLDARGRVMPPLAAGRPDLEAALESLPVVTGLGGMALRVGREVDAPALRAALEVVVRFPLSPMAGRAQLATLDVAEADQVRVLTVEGAEVILPLQRPEEHLHRWRLVEEAGARAGRQIRWLDLSVTNNCPLLWQAPERAPAPPPPAVETYQPGGRHV